MSAAVVYADAVVDVVAVVVVVMLFDPFLPHVVDDNLKVDVERECAQELQDAA